MSLTVNVGDAVRLIKKGRCVLFLGAGAPAGAGLPLARDLKRRLIRRALDSLPTDSDAKLFDQFVRSVGSLLQHVGGIGAKSLDDISLERCVQLLCSSVGKQQIIEYLRDSLGKVDRWPSCYTVIDELVELGLVQNILTVNFDRLLRRMDKLNPAFLTSQFEGRYSELLSGVSCNTLWELHGTIDDPSSLILKDEDVTKLPEPKRRVVVDLLTSRHTLFVGYSAGDEDLKPILREAAKLLSERNGVRWLWISRSISQEASSILRLKEEKQLAAFPMTADEFFRELRRSLESTLAQRRSFSLFIESLDMSVYDSLVIISVATNRGPMSLEQIVESVKDLSLLFDYPLKSLNEDALKHVVRKLTNLGILLERDSTYTLAEEKKTIEGLRLLVAEQFWEVLDKEKARIRLLFGTMPEKDKFTDKTGIQLPFEEGKPITIEDLQQKTPELLDCTSGKLQVVSTYADWLFKHRNRLAGMRQKGVKFEIIVMEKPIGAAGLDWKNCVHGVRQAIGDAGSIKALPPEEIEIRLTIFGGKKGIAFKRPLVDRTIESLTFYDSPKSMRKLIEYFDTQWQKPGATQI